MKVKARLISCALIAAVFTVPAASAKIRGLSGAGDPCEVLVCMTGKAQGSAQPGCISVNQRFFNIRAYTPFYNPGATYSVRRNFLNTCSGAAVNQAAINLIMARYGSVFQA